MYDSEHISNHNLDLQNKRRTKKKKKKKNISKEKLLIE